MKLNRKNKYTKRIALGLTTLVFSGLLVSPNVKEVETTVEDNYNETVVYANPELEKLKIKDGSITEPLSYNVLVSFYNANGDYKVVLAKCYGVKIENTFKQHLGLYDAFSDELLFVTPEEDTTIYGAASDMGLDLGNIVYCCEGMKYATSLKVDYFCSMLDMGLSCGCTKEDILKFLPATFETGEYMCDTETLANMYITFVPKEYRVSADELQNGFNTEKVKTL